MTKSPEDDGSPELTYHQTLLSTVETKARRAEPPAAPRLHKHKHSPKTNAHANKMPRTQTKYQQAIAIVGSHLTRTSITLKVQFESSHRFFPPLESPLPTSHPI